MKALRYWGSEGGVLEDVEMPELLPGGVLLKVESCGVSDLDIKVFSGAETDGEGMIPGTHFAGTVTAVSEGCSCYKAGDRLAVSRMWACGSCHACEMGDQRFCMDMPGELKGLPGGMAEYVSLSKDFLKHGWIVKIPDNVSCHEAAVADVASAVYKCQEQYGIGPGKRLLIIGSGPAGCMHTQIAKLRGADIIIQTDCFAGRLEMARPFRADCLVDSEKEDLSEIVTKETRGKGIDIAVITSPDARVMEQVLPVMAHKGRIILFSRFEYQEALVDLAAVQHKEIQICGTEGYEKRHLTAVLDLASRRKLTLKWLVTKEAGLKEIDKALEEIKSKKQLKVVIHP